MFAGGSERATQRRGAARRLYLSKLDDLRQRIHYHSVKIRRVKLSYDRLRVSGGKSQEEDDGEDDGENRKA